MNFSRYNFLPYDHLIVFWASSSSVAVLGDTDDTGSVCSSGELHFSKVSGSTLSRRRACFVIGRGRSLTREITSDTSVLVDIALPGTKRDPKEALGVCAGESGSPRAAAN